MDPPGGRHKANNSDPSEGRRPTSALYAKIRAAHAAGTSSAGDNNAHLSSLPPPLPAPVTFVYNPASWFNAFVYTVGTGVPATVTRVIVLHDVTSIAEAAFSGRSRLTEVILSPGIQTIGRDAFQYCIALEKVEIPPSAAIKESSFEGCMRLKAVTLCPGSSIGKSAFKNCHVLEKIEIPPSTVIEESAFESTGLKEVSLPPGLQRIGKSVFKHCISLAKVEIPLSVVSIGESAFADCTKLTNVTLHPGLERIRKSTFERCFS